MRNQTFLQNMFTNFEVETVNHYEDAVHNDPEYTREYFMMALGFQLQILVLHFQKERKPSFYEMLLHHIITIILICNSWMIDQLRPGLITMWVHDVSDSILFMGRICNDFKVENKICTYSVYTCTLIAWVFFRLWLFPKLVVFPVLKYSL